MVTAKHLPVLDQWVSMVSIENWHMFGVVVIGQTDSKTASPELVFCMQPIKGHIKKTV